MKELIMIITERLDKINAVNQIEKPPTNFEPLVGFNTITGKFYIALVNTDKGQFDYVYLNKDGETTTFLGPIGTTNEDIQLDLELLDVSLWDDKFSAQTFYEDWKFSETWKEQQNEK